MTLRNLLTIIESLNRLRTTSAYRNCQSLNLKLFPKFDGNGGKPFPYAQPKQPFSMKYVLLTVGLFIQTLSFSQTKPPLEVTPELQKKIMQDIDKEVPKLKQRFSKDGYNAVQIEFTVDTFRVEHFMAKWVDLDYRDFGMRDAGYATAELYDSLLNKYYKMLLLVLKGEDKKVLVKAQKTWLAYRDSETNLVGTVSKEEYSGGGTMQQLTEASGYLDLVKNRTIALFEHYVRATQSY
jgi:uncharacterized protein YecT (DUF1311 family)